MNLMTTNNQPLTMSSREIAELTGKRHDHVLRDIRVMLSGLELDKPDSPNFGGIYIDDSNRRRECFLLPKDLTITLISGYNVKMRHTITTRWIELEEKQKPQLPDFSDPVAAARAWANETEQKLIAQKQLELAAPKVAFVDNLVERKNLLTATQVGQKHKMSAIKLNKILDELGVYNGVIKRSRAFNQWFIDKGYGEMKQNESGYDQPLFTNAGEVWINEQLHSEGII